MQKKTVRLVLISLAVGDRIRLMMLEFPIFAAIPGLQHLKLDFGDVPAAVARCLAIARRRRCGGAHQKPLGTARAWDRLTDGLRQSDESSGGVRLCCAVCLAL